MNRPLTMQDVRDLLVLRPDPMEGLVEMEFEWCLGRVTLSKHEPVFRIGYGHYLKPDSHFYKLPFDLDGKTGIAVVLRVFDPHSPNPDQPEYLAGWVPVDRDREVDRWLELLNGEIRARLGAGTGTEQPASATPATGKERREKKLTPIAFKELGFPNDPAAPSLVDVRGKRRADHKADVIAYLKRGRRITFAMGIEKDVFDPTKLADSLSAITDETYRWPAALAYYVEHYDVALPVAFEEHMRSKGWKHR